MTDGEIKPAPVLATQLHIPPARPQWVARPRLIQILDRGIAQGHRLILVSAPAGFGKTTLLSSWAAHLRTAPKTEETSRPTPDRVAWFSVDENDNDPARFWGHFVAALDIGRAAQDGLRATDPASSAMDLTNLINELSAWLGGPCDAGRLIIILDDYHLVETQAIHQSIAFLLEHLPDEMHMVLAGRSEPPLPLPRLRVRGQMTELHEGDLRFTPEEAAAFLNKVMNLNLSQQDVTFLETRTEGWIAGLQLAALSMRGREDVSAFVQAFGGTHRFVLDYLAEEVLQQQDGRVQTFLKQTSILGRLTASLCDAVTNSREARQLLPQLEQANLFLIALDDQRAWYRYHHLFAEFLRQQIHQQDPDLVPVLHQRASAWYEQRAADLGTSGKGKASAGDTLLAEAIEHALQAQDFERAARLVERAAEATIMRSELATFSDWIEALPDELVAGRTFLCLFHAWALLLAGQPVDKARARLRDADQGDPLASAKMALMEAFIAAFQGRVPRATELSHHALENLAQDDWLLRSVATWNLGVSYVWRGDFAAGDRALAQAVQMSHDTGNVMIAVVAQCHRAELYTFLGQLREAKRLYDQALAWSTVESKRLPIAGMVLIGLGELLREWNELQTAIDHLLEGIERTREWGQIGTLDGHIALARVRQAQGDLSGAKEAIEEAARVAVLFDATEVDDRFVAAHRAQLWVAQGNLRAAQDWVRSIALTPEIDPTRLAETDSNTSFANYLLFEREVLAYVRLLLALGQARDAQCVLDRISPVGEREGRIQNIVETQLLRALALQGQGDHPRAVVAIERALALAEPEGFVRLFADEGKPVARLLRQAAASGASTVYVSKLLEAIDAPAASPSSTLVEPLGKRELQVLRLIAAGLSNQEIADELVVAVSTVKWHINNIYGKLGVHSRTQALARARELELL